MADENTDVTPETTETSSTSSNNKMNPTMIIVGIVAVIAIVAGLFFYMGSGKNVGEESMQTNETSMPATGDEAATESAVQGMDAEALNITVEGGSFYFKPNEIRAKVGQTVKVTLNAVSMQHDFVIDELDVKSAVIPSGQTTTVEFVASEAGEFEFYCSVGNHRAQGMVGTLIVE